MVKLLKVNSARASAATRSNPSTVSHYRMVGSLCPLSGVFHNTFFKFFSDHGEASPGTIPLSTIAIVAGSEIGGALKSDERSESLMSL